MTRKSSHDNRFQGGFSGNPKGRPVKSALPIMLPPLSNFDKKILEKGRKTICQKDGTYTTVIEALISQISYRGFASKGADREKLAPGNESHRSAKLFIELFKSTSDAEAWSNAIMLAHCIDGKLEIEKYFQSERRKKRPAPNIVPHPDHVLIDGDIVTVFGPTTEEGRAAWEILKYWIHEVAHEQRQLQAKLKGAPDNQDLLIELEWAKKLRRQRMPQVPKGWNWKEKIWTLDADPVSMAKNLVGMLDMVIDQQQMQLLVHSFSKKL